MGEIGHNKVLIIDDTQAGAFLTCELLNDECLDARDVSIARSALSAMFQIGSQSYDLIVCNDQLDTMSGHDLINLVRSGGISVPVILLRDEQPEDQTRESDPMVISILDRQDISAAQIMEAVQGHLDGGVAGAAAQNQRAEAW